MKGSEKLCQNVKTAYTPTGTTGTKKAEYTAITADADIFIQRTDFFAAATSKTRINNKFF